MLARLLGCQKEKCNSYLTLWIGWVPSYEVFVICHLIHIFFFQKTNIHICILNVIV